MVEKEKIIEESRILYSEIDSCITELLGARTTHNSEEEGKALFRVEGLMVGVLQHLSCIIDTLPEQPKLKPMNISSAGGGMSTTPPSYKLDVKPEQLIGLDDENAADKKAVKEIVKTVHKEITRQVKEMVGKQPVEGLEEECERFYRTDEYKMADILGRGFETIARHFAEWGAEHLKK